MAILASLRLSEREVYDLQRAISSSSPGQLYDLLREIDAEYFSHPFLQELTHRGLLRVQDPIVEQMMREANQIRTKELRISVLEFARKLEALARKRKPPLSIPPFDPRKGFRNWIAALVDEIGPSETYGLIARLREEEGAQVQRSWPLRRS